MQTIGPLGLLLMVLGQALATASCGPGITCDYDYDYLVPDYPAPGYPAPGPVDSYGYAAPNYPVPAPHYPVPDYEDPSYSAGAALGAALGAGLRALLSGHDDHHSADPDYPPVPAPDYPAPDYPAPDYPAPDYPAPDYPAPGSLRGTGNRHCAYNCQKSGGCEVRWTGPPRRGQIKGSCFPPSFGGACSGTPRECDDCSSHCYVAPAPAPAPAVHYCATHKCGSNNGPPSPPVPVRHHQGGGGGGDDDCQYDCTDWPYSQCTMKWRSGYGSGTATCINPFTSRHGYQKFSNYPKCATIPTGCSRCDDHCAQRDGRAGRNDY